ncbi:Uncharacterised protein [Mycobacteroides abscessus subsp. abscessus]|nr:Uncharacterised protein [Mycobacteroides abscessus subsp. abscessus]
MRSGSAPELPYTTASPTARAVYGSTNTARRSDSPSVGSANSTRVVSVGPGAGATATRARSGRTAVAASTCSASGRAVPVASTVSRSRETTCSRVGAIA